MVDVGEWHQLGAVAPAELRESRIELHWSVQFIAAVADACADHRTDDSHTTIEWSDARNGFIGIALPRGVRVGVTIAPLAVFVESSNGDDILPLAGKTLNDGLHWLTQTLGEHLGGAQQFILRDYDMPDHRVRGGEAFSSGESPGLVELGRYYSNSQRLLRKIAAGDGRATAIACWPHHFDIAGIIYLNDTDRSPQSPQIGFGMSPGDGYYAQPYFYTTPFPVPESATFPPLPGPGQWHERDFIGTILTASRLLELSSAREQRLRVEAYFSTALTAAQALATSDG